MDKAEKARRSVIKRSIRAEEQNAILTTLPISMDTLNELFDFIDEKLGMAGCDDTLRFASDFIELNSLPNEALTDGLRANGGYCDCEIIANVQEEING